MPHKCPEARREYGRRYKQLNSERIKAQRVRWNRQNALSKEIYKQLVSLAFPCEYRKSRRDEKRRQRKKYPERNAIELSKRKYGPYWEHHRLAVQIKKEIKNEKA